MFDEKNSQITRAQPSLITTSKKKAFILTEENSVPNRIQPRKQAGLYMIRCIQNDWRYYGESINVAGRLA
jgi:hypothetical protein